MLSRGRIKDTSDCHTPTGSRISIRIEILWVSNRQLHATLQFMLASFVVGWRGGGVLRGIGGDTWCSPKQSLDTIFGHGWHLTSSIDGGLGRGAGFQFFFFCFFRTMGGEGGMGSWQGTSHRCSQSLYGTLQICLQGGHSLTYCSKSSTTNKFVSIGS